jgi:hypothetical protein
MQKPAALPLWPLHLMVALVPLWWVLGGFYLSRPVLVST